VTFLSRLRFGSLLGVEPPNYYFYTFTMKVRPEPVVRVEGKDSKV